jgi:uncharacterized LabA/DUF88 family protein
MLKPSQELVAVKYFTTRVSYPEESAKRQSTYLDALRVRGGIEIVYGNFIWNPDGCETCGATWDRREEKQTDVNIAVHMLGDAQDGLYDAALLVSADSDQVPAVKEISLRHPQRRVIIACPPARFSDELVAAASSFFHLKRSIFSRCQLPQLVPDPTTGYVLCQPTEWWKEPIRAPAT